FIRSNFRGADVEPEIIVHEHCGESGAIGAAVEARRLWTNGRRTSFIGLDAVQRITYRTTRNESTRCNFCKNNCLRTFIDIKMAEGPSESSVRLQPDESRRVGLQPDDIGPAKAGHHEAPKVAPLKFISKVPKAEDERRLIIATCEKGGVEDVNDMRGIKAGIDEVKKANPNFIEIAAKEPFRPRGTASVADSKPSRLWTRAAKE